jgi:transcriptional regulator with XRE-family HTH domain
MAVTRRARDIGAERAHRIVVDLGRDLRDARRLSGLSQERVAAAAGISHSHLSRIEHGRVPNLSIDLASRLASIVGLDLSVRTFASGTALRDIGQVRLLNRFRPLVHSTIPWRTEVVVGGRRDPRAWDVVLDAGRDRAGVEAESHIHDWQALERRISLRQRDTGMEIVILVLADTRHNRAVLRELGPALTANFPEPGGTALRELRRGQLPKGSTIVLV